MMGIWVLLLLGNGIIPLRPRLHLNRPQRHRGSLPSPLALPLVPQLIRMRVSQFLQRGPILLVRALPRLSPPEQLLHPHVVLWVYFLAPEHSLLLQLHADVLDAAEFGVEVGGFGGQGSFLIR